MMPGLVSQNGYDYMAIQVVFDIHNIEMSRRPDMLMKITKLINVIDTEKRNRKQ